MAWPKGKPRKPLDIILGEPKSWVCIRQHYNNVQIVKVGEVVQAEESPGKHWQECDKDNPNILDRLRKQLDELGVTWSPDWDVKRLEFECSREESWRHQQQRREAWKKETGARL